MFPPMAFLYGVTLWENTYRDCSSNWLYLSIRIHAAYVHFLNSLFLMTKVQEPKKACYSEECNVEPIKSCSPELQVIGYIKDIRRMHLVHAFESTHLCSSCLSHLVVESHLEKSHIYDPMPSFILRVTLEYYQQRALPLSNLLW